MVSDNGAAPVAEDCCTLDGPTVAGCPVSDRYHSAASTKRAPAAT
jgi:hypothetical protein